MAYDEATMTFDGEEVNVCDPIHGDYVIKMPYSKLVMTKEMQRLKEISQTGFSFYDYPNMFYEDRLAHSLGAFHIMEKILDKLTVLLKKTPLKISKDDREVALCAILLHDIGHGPFSHSFEAITNYSHEKRTTDILLGDTEVSKTLCAMFDEAKVRRIASFIAEIDESENKDKEFEDTAFTRLMKSLISHQIDADRLDYLVRDAYYAGIETSINIDKIINAVSIALNAQGDFEVIMDKRNLTLIETPLIERFQHYRDIYFTYGSVIGDRMFKTLLKVMKENREKNLEKNFAPEFIKLILDPENLSLEDFLKLTDRQVYEFLTFVAKNSKNLVVRRLASGKKTIDGFMIFEDVLVKEKIALLMKKLAGSDVIMDHSCFEISAKTKFYKKDEGFKIRINQSIVDLTDVTNLVNARDYVEMKCTVFNPEMFFYENKLSKKYKSKKEFIDEVYKNISYINPKEQEFELKYICPNLRTGTKAANAILEMLEKSFKLVSEKSNTNYDNYYDTPNYDLYRSNKILRARHKGDKYIGTYKQPLHTGEIYTSRTEIEEELTGDNLVELEEKMARRGVVLPEGICDTPALQVENYRDEYVLQKDDGRVCFCIDNVAYYSFNQLLNEEIMIEIEAYDDIKDRVLLTEINDKIDTFAEKRNLDIEITHESKYSRGMKWVVKKE